MVNKLDLSKYIALKDASNGPKTFTIAIKRKEVPIHYGTEEETGKNIKSLTCRMHVDLFKFQHGLFHRLFHC